MKKLLELWIEHCSILIRHTNDPTMKKELITMQREMLEALHD